MTQIACKVTFSYELIHASIAEKHRWQLGVRSCIVTGLPTHLVQELNVVTVASPVEY